MALSRACRVVATAVLLTLTIAPVSHSQTEPATERATIQIEPPERPPIWAIYNLRNPDAFQPTLPENAPYAGNLVIAPTVTEKTERNLRGFRGFYYTDDVGGEGVVILPPSLNISSEGKWSAMGLARNETTDNVYGVTVTAQLLSAQGTVLETLSAQALVKNIRPGEPAPFRIASSIPADQVKAVIWSTVEEAAGPDISREANIMTWWQLPFGSDTYKGIKRDDPPYPYVLATGFNNLGRAMKSAVLVVAWTDEAGKVLRIKTSPLDDGFKDGVSEGGAASFQNMVEDDPILGPELGKNPYTMWVMGE